MSDADRWEGALEDAGEPAELAPEHEAPATSSDRETNWVADHDTRSRDTRPALGTPGEPGPWTAERPDAAVALAGPGFGDARWSFLYKLHDSRYAATAPAPGQVAAANRRMRSAPAPALGGPFIKAPVWTWEIPLYFWVGGLASGAAFVALACDFAGDDRSARIARRVALGTVVPAPLLLISDLGRPERFLNMLRIFKPRSPMNLGAWCLVAFSGTTALAVGADLRRRPKAARALGTASAVIGGYLGSYTGVLLACTAVPVWSRSRTLLPPIFAASATAGGAATTRLTLRARGLADDHPTGRALAAIETGAVVTELMLAALGERRLGDAAEALRRGQPGVVYRAGQGLVVLGLSMRVLIRDRGRAHDLASVVHLAAGLAFRFAWVNAGRQSAEDDAVVAAGATGRSGRAGSITRSPRPLPNVAQRAYGEAIRRASLAVERLLGRRHRA